MQPHHPGKLCPTVLFIVFVVFLVSGSRAQDSVRRSTPTNWEHFQKSLVSIEEARKLTPVPVADKEGVKSETLVQNFHSIVNEDGSAITMTQTIQRLNQESSREKFSAKTFRFSPMLEEISIITARTIQPDGTIVDVEGEGLFLEQKDSGSDKLFTDDKQVRVIFPNVEVDSLIETVTVKERKVLVPNQWSFTTLMKSLVPMRSNQVIVDVPEKLVGQVTWDDSFAEAERSELDGPNGMKRFVWRKTSVAPEVVQSGMPNPYLNGPYLRVGVGKGWDQFGQWFSGLVSESRGEDDESIKKLAKEWAGKEKKPQKIAAKLFEKVSQGIRYTGLEFGKGAFQPRDPTLVIETGYGDCKDKSNLLRLLLKEHGIESRIALISSSPHGEFPKTVPAVGLFNHAILAIYFEGRDKPVICDPTVEGIPLGLVIDRDQGKEIFVVDEDGSYTWERMPKREAAKNVMNVDFELTPLGTYQGWIEMKISGASGYVLNQYFSKLETRSEQNQFAVRALFPFVDRLRLVDGEQVGSTKEFPFHYRFYGIQSREKINPESRAIQFMMPVTRSAIARVGRSGIRVHPYFSYPQEVACKVSLKLPEGWEVLDRRGALKSRGVGYDFTANWEADTDSNQLIGKLNVSRSRYELSAREFNGLSDGVRELAAWLGGPVLLLRPENTGTGEGGAWTPNPKEIEKMPTSEGYNVLVNEWFPFDPQNPFDADHKSRKMAYQRMAKLYPKSDHEGQFSAKIMVQMSRLFDSLYGDEGTEIAKRISKIIETYEEQVDESKISAAEILVASALTQAGDAESAIATCERILGRGDKVPEEVKLGASGILGLLVAEDEPKRAIELLSLALKSQLSGTDDLVAYLTTKLDCVARLPDASVASINEEVRSSLAEYSDLEEAYINTYIEAPNLLVIFGHQKEAYLFLKAIKASGDEFGVEKDDLEALDEYFDSLEKVKPIHSELAEFLKENPWPDLDKLEEGDVIENSYDCVELYLDDLSVVARYLLRGMSEFGPQPDMADRIEEFFDNYSEWKDDDEMAAAMPKMAEATVDFLIELWLRCPEGDYSNSSAAVSAKSERIQEKDGDSQAIEFLMSLYKDESESDLNRVAAAGEIEGFRSREKDLKGYVAALKLAEPFTSMRAWRDVNIVEGAYLNVVLGDLAESKRLFQLIVDDSSDESAYPNQSEILAKSLLKDFEKHQAWWQGSEKWWPQWVEVGKALDISVDESDFSLRPWVKVSKKDVTKYLKIKQAKKKKRLVKFYLLRQLQFVRFHSSGKKEALRLLESAAELFPKQKDSLEALIKSIDPTLRVEG